MFVIKNDFKHIWMSNHCLDVVSHAENLDQSINQPGNNLMHSKESYPQTKKMCFHFVVPEITTSWN